MAPEASFDISSSARASRPDSTRSRLLFTVTGFAQGLGPPRGYGAVRRLPHQVAAALTPVLASIPLPTQGTSNGTHRSHQYSENTNITENILFGPRRREGSDHDILTRGTRPGLAGRRGHSTSCSHRVVRAATSTFRSHAKLHRVLPPTPAIELTNEVKFGLNRFAALSDNRSEFAAADRRQPSTGVNVVPGLAADTSSQYVLRVHRQRVVSRVRIREDRRQHPSCVARTSRPQTPRWCSRRCPLRRGIVRARPP